MRMATTDRVLFAGSASQALAWLGQAMVCLPVLSLGRRCNGWNPVNTEVHPMNMG